MESKINLEELILRQYEVSLSVKERLEAKAGIYLAIVTLVLTVLLEFLSFLFNDQFTITMETRQKVSKLILSVFIVGLVELVICASMIFPRLVWYFSIERLMNLYHHKDFISGKRIDQMLLNSTKGFVIDHEGQIDYLRKTYAISSIVLILLMIGVIVISIIIIHIIFLGDF